MSYRKTVLVGDRILGHPLLWCCRMFMIPDTGMAIGLGWTLGRVPVLGLLNRLVLLMNGSGSQSDVLR
ncbi:MAG: hypothetical protein AAFX78_13270 [Cyanobacteria bacterium J06638_20]